MLLAYSASFGSGRRSVALSPAPVRRQTKPGCVSASALIRSRFATNSATSGSPTGASRRSCHLHAVTFDDRVGEQTLAHRRDLGLGVARRQVELEHAADANIGHA